jgi:predicted nucleotidyltransferase
MSDNIDNLIPYPDINTVLHRLRSNVQNILKEQFIGMYIHGSLASGDFDPQRSDIDFLVVTASELPEKMIMKLKTMHARIANSNFKWAKKLEGSYIPKQALQQSNPPDVPRPYVNEGNFYLSRYGNEWTLERHITREHGIVIDGPAPKTLINYIQPNDLRRSTLKMLHKWWLPILHNPARLHSSEYRAYAILTMCRILYTLQHGTLVSKSVAAQWALKSLDERFTVLIKRALVWQEGTQLDILNETIGFIQYTLEHSQQSKIPTGKRSKIRSYHL